MRSFKRFVIFTAILLTTFSLFAQEALLSEEEQYYDLLALSDVFERPYMNFRTLSDSNWDTDKLDESNNLWINNSLSTDYFFMNNSLHLKVYDPEWFNSYNSAAPYGQNDGALWQGRGYNTKLTGGARFEAYGLEITLKPEIDFSQNKEYAYPSSSYGGSLYEGKAGVYGDYSLGSVDAPQRFGDKAFATFDWGDSEIRYSWKTLTAGFGTQAIWLGPAQLNPIMHSNNAAGYPKVDFGIRKQSLYFKDWWLGNIEFRYWIGKLTESEYFDNNDDNNDTLNSALAIAYEVPFLPGMTVGLNRSMLSHWSNRNSYTMWGILVPFIQRKAGFDESDQRASVVANYFAPKGGIDIYLEWGKNDYNSGLDNLLRYPFHTQAITAGFKKAIDYKRYPSLKGQFIFELTYLETSMDYHFFYDWGGWGNDFYTHHLITQGYTNKGQYLGAGIGGGGNAQYIGYKLYYPKGYTSFFAQRTNPDLNYSYFKAERGNVSPNEYVKTCIRVNVDLGVSSLYYITDDLRVTFSLILDDQHNPLNTNSNITKDTASPGRYPSEHRYNFVTQCSIKYYF